MCLKDIKTRFLKLAHDVRDQMMHVMGLKVLFHKYCHPNPQHKISYCMDAQTPRLAIAFPSSRMSHTPNFIYKPYNHVTSTQLGYHILTLMI